MLVGAMTCPHTLHASIVSLLRRGSTLRRLPGPREPAPPPQRVCARGRVRLRRRPDKRTGHPVGVTACPAPHLTRGCSASAVDYDLNGLRLHSEGCGELL